MKGPGKVGYIAVVVIIACLNVSPAQEANTTPVPEP